MLDKQHTSTNQTTDLAPLHASISLRDAAGLASQWKKGVMECPLPCLAKIINFRFDSWGGRAGNTQTPIKRRTLPLPQDCHFRHNSEGAAPQWQEKLTKVNATLPFLA